MKHHKNKKFNVPKFLFIFVGLLSCVGALYIQKTLSYFYTSYGFANTFQTPDLGSVEIYQKASIPDLWFGERVTDEFHIANKSSDSRYLRVAHVKIGMNSRVQCYWLLSDISSAYMFDTWNDTNGIRGETDTSSADSPLNEDKWIENDIWYYYKVPLAAQTDIQIYDSFAVWDNYPKPSEDTGNYYYYDASFIVETLPTTVTDEEFQNAWGVSKSELGLS